MDLSAISLKSSCWPRSRVSVMTSASYFSWSHFMMTEVSRPPE